MTVARGNGQAAKRGGVAERPQFVEKMSDKTFKKKRTDEAAIAQREGVFHGRARRSHHAAACQAPAARVRSRRCKKSASARAIARTVPSHRRLSARRFVGPEKAQLLSMIDLDGALYCEFEGATLEPLALIETALDRGQRRKAATVTRRLAQRARLPAYAVLYAPAMYRNPADPSQQDIERFRVKRLWPTPEREWRVLNPLEWAEALVQIRAWAARRLGQEAANDPVYER